MQERLKDSQVAVLTQYIETVEKALVELEQKIDQNQKVINNATAQNAQLNTEVIRLQASRDVMKQTIATFNPPQEKEGAPSPSTQEADVIDMTDAKSSQDE